MTERASNGKSIESVWDYPRPPRLDPVDWRIRVVHGGRTIVDAPRAVRVLETSQPPAYYVAPEFVDESCLMRSPNRTMCEWKGLADYAHVLATAGEDGVEPAVAVPDAAWTYRNPTPSFVSIRDHWAFYAQKCDECWVDDERVAPNDGSFYGGWITANVTGPFKGAPGTSHW